MTDFGFLRTIPEDRSQVASSVAASNPNSNGIGEGNAGEDDATSVRAVEAGRDGGSGSVVSDAKATLAGGGSSGGRGGGDNNKTNSSVESGDHRRGQGGTGGGGGGGGGQARRGGGNNSGSGYDDAGSNIGVLPGTSDISPRRRGGRRQPAGRQGHHHHHSKHASCLERAFCYWPRSKRKKTCIWVLAILVVTAFVLCVVLLTTTANKNTPSPIDEDNNNNTGDQQPPSASLTPIVASSPTASPTPEATIPVATIMALDTMLLTLTPAEILYPQQPRGFEGLGPDQDQDNDEQPTTPQAQARDWMLHDDLRRDEVLADGKERVLQRYSLVVFFISTGRPDYLDGAQQECQWPGIYCEANPDINLGGGSGSSGSSTELGGSSGGGDFDAVSAGATGDDLLQLVVRGILLPFSNLTGTLPSELRTLTYLGELHIPDNNITGVIPSDWFVLVPPPSTGLEETTPVAVVNATTTTLPPTSSTSTQAPISTTPTTTTTTTTEESEPGLYSLFWFDASRNQLSGTIPPGLWSLPYIRFVYLGDNDLSGPLETLTVDSTSPTYVLPTTTTDSSSSNLVLSALLEDVRLNDNRLSGTIPSWLLSRPTLRAIVASNNQFNGSLLSSPQDGDDNDSLQQAISLSVLDLSNNSLTGPLPNNLFSTVAAYSTLHYLYLENNQFTGPLPIDNSTAGGGDVFVALMDVWLYNNNLQGSIPLGFAQGWSNLTELLLHGNPLLTGELEMSETTSAAPVAASTLAPVVGASTNSSLTSPSLSDTPTTTTPLPDTCKSTWPMLQRMTSDCKATSDETYVVCPCCTECY